MSQFNINQRDRRLQAQTQSELSSKQQESYVPNEHWQVLDLRGIWRVLSEEAAHRHRHGKCSSETGRPARTSLCQPATSTLVREWKLLRVQGWCPRPVQEETADTLLGLWTYTLISIQTLTCTLQESLLRNTKFYELCTEEKSWICRTKSHNQHMRPKQLEAGAT